MRWLQRSVRRIRSISRNIHRHRPVWRLWRVYLTQPRTRRGLMKRLMNTNTSHPIPPTNSPAAHDAAAAMTPRDTNATSTEVTTAATAPKPARLLILVRHGESTYNVEGRLPGQLPGVLLTDEGRRQALRAAVALSGIALTSVIASPLERARETAEIIARGWGVPVRLDPRLMDTDVGEWAGQKPDDISKTDPRWKEFVEHPTAPPAGVESLASVQARAVAVVEELRRDPSLGDTMVLVAHADIVKLILGHYSGVPIDATRFVHIANASLSALSFVEDAPPYVLAMNWTALPYWLQPRTQSAPAAAEQHNTQPSVAAAEQTPASASATPAEGAGSAGRVATEQPLQRDISDADALASSASSAHQPRS